MSETNLRLVQSFRPSGSADLPADRRAEQELADLFGGLLAEPEGSDEAPDYELLEAAVDGRLDPVEAEIFASQMVGDALLRAEFDDLVQLRERLKVAAAPERTLEVGGDRNARHFKAATAWRWVGAAAAATLIFAAGLEMRSGRTDRSRALVAGSSAAQSAEQPLFADSFEGGKLDRWSN
ncbi:MAG: hypothetical protein ABI639_02700 [Thermoanaerobaculia bacterium]